MILWKNGSLLSCPLLFDFAREGGGRESLA
jgi:hypothetical protein